MFYLIVARDNPTSFGLPVIIVNQHLEMLLNPFVSWDITSLTSHGDICQGRNIKLLNPISIEIVPRLQKTKKVNN